MQWIFVIFYTISSSLYTISSFVLGRSAIKMTLGPSQPPTPSCIYTSMYLEVCFSRLNRLELTEVSTSEVWLFGAFN